MSPVKVKTAPEPRWLLAPPASREELLDVMRAWRVSPPLAQVLHGRGLTRELLDPPLTLTPNPALREAARRIVKAVAAKKRIRIHGDYDADGVTCPGSRLNALRRRVLRRRRSPADPGRTVSELSASGSRQPRHAEIAVRTRGVEADHDVVGPGASGRRRQRRAGARAA